MVLKNLLRPLLIITLIIGANLNVAVAIAGNVDAENICNSDAIEPSTLIRLQTNSEKSVMKLEDFKNFSSQLDIDQKILFETNFFQKEMRHKQDCFLQVSVFVDRKDEARRFLWMVYLVDFKGKVRFYLNQEGKFVTLTQHTNKDN